LDAADRGRDVCGAFRAEAEVGGLVREAGRADEARATNGARRTARNAREVVHEERKESSAA